MSINGKPWITRSWKEVLKTSISCYIEKKILLSAVKRNLDIRPWRMYEATPALSRGESQGPKLTGHVGGPRDEINITESEALQVLQLINFLQLQAHWPLNSTKPARISLLQPCSFFCSVWYLHDWSDVMSFLGRTAQEETAGLPWTSPFLLAFETAGGGFSSQKAVRMSETFDRTVAKFS